MGEQAGLLGGEDEAGQVLVAQELEEGAERGGGAGDAGGPAPAAGQEAGHEVLDAGPGQGALEVPQVPAVGEDRIAAEAAFDLQIAQELVDLYLHRPVLPQIGRPGGNLDSLLGPAV